MQLVKLIVLMFVLSVVPASMFGQVTLSDICAVVPNTEVTVNGTATDNIAWASIGCTKLIFVTSQSYQGNFGGKVVANQSCQSAASTAGLPGKYKAWLEPVLGTGGLFDFMYQSPVEYRTLDNHFSSPSKIADDWTDLISGTLDGPIIETELGTTADGGGAPGWTWTGLDSDGTGTAYNCVGWSSNSSSDYGTCGRVSHTDSGWSNIGHCGCNNSFALYCIQQ